MKNGKNPFGECVPELTRVSSKGQLVIPLDLRKKLKVKEGSVFAVSNIDGDMLILKKVKNPLTAEDIETARIVGESWKDIERGDYKEYGFDEFLGKLDKM
jgi:AbrB family looped-hinge helix DNA binding protein